MRQGDTAAPMLGGGSSTFLTDHETNEWSQSWRPGSRPDSKRPAVGTGVSQHSDLCIKFRVKRPALETPACRGFETMQ